MIDGMPSVSVVVPAVNEARNLELVLPGLPDELEVILVDGGSVDKTVETARRVRPGIITLQQTRRGKGNALACGFEAATADIIVMFDADGSADPAEIPRFVEALVDGADFAKGSRFCSGPNGYGSSDDITALRSAGNAALNKLANVLFRTGYTDLCYGYNAFWRHLLPILRLPASRISGVDSNTMLWGDGFEIESVISCRVAAAGLRVAEVPSRERLRAFGETNLRTFADGFRVLRTILAERAAALGTDGRSRPLPQPGRRHDHGRNGALPPARMNGVAPHSPEAILRDLDASGRTTGPPVPSPRPDSVDAPIAAVRPEGSRG
jgi:glycosyltransferase involved in cell wall biosynthesis